MHQDLLEAVIVPQFRLDINGIHGIRHWERVWENGQRVAEIIHKSGAGAVDLEVVELFAWLHDSQREDENRDYFHGQRAGQYIMSLRALTYHINIKSAQFAKLVTAVMFHSDGIVLDDPTIQTCWDADRLDLTRVGETPDPRYLSKEAASLI